MYFKSEIHRGIKDCAQVLIAAKEYSIKVIQADLEKLFYFHWLLMEAVYPEKQYQNGFGLSKKNQTNTNKNKQK